MLFRGSLEPQHQPVDFFASSNPPELAVKVSQRSFWLSSVVFVGVLILFGLEDIGHARTIEELQLLKSEPHGNE
jgi:hypothetical protein